MGFKVPGRKVDVLGLKPHNDISIKNGSVKVIQFAVTHELDRELKLSKRIFNVGDGEGNSVHGTSVGFQTTDYKL
jgi:hypothetical protein